MSKQRSHLSVGYTKFGVFVLVLGVVLNAMLSGSALSEMVDRSLPIARGSEALSAPVRAMERVGIDRFAYCAAAQVMALFFYFFAAMARRRAFAGVVLWVGALLFPAEMVVVFWRLM